MIIISLKSNNDASGQSQVVSSSRKYSYCTSS
jgi:hypothetical protein